MTNFLLILHLIVTLTLIGTVLIQRSEGGGLGIGTTQGMGSFMSGRGTANLLTRLTAVLAAIFMVLSLTLAVMNRGTAGVGRDILAQAPGSTQAPGSNQASGSASTAGQSGHRMLPALPPAPPKPTGPTVPTQ